jgi:hypothetical protein
MTDQTLLLRQVHPSFIQDGKVTSQVFRPTPKDEERLSFYNGDMISPYDAWTRYTARPTCHSIGILVVSHGECVEQELAVVEDANPYPEHCSIIFSSFTKSQIEKKAKTLKVIAEGRGWLYKA